MARSGVAVLEGHAVWRGSQPRITACELVLASASTEAFRELGSCAVFGPVGAAGPTGKENISTTSQVKVFVLVKNSGDEPPAIAPLKPATPSSLRAKQSFFFCQHPPLFACAPPPRPTPRRCWLRPTPQPVSAKAQGRHIVESNLSRREKMTLRRARGSM